MSPARRDDGPVAPPGDAGFMLLEVLASTAVAGVLLAAIGAVVAVTLTSIRSAPDRVALAETAQTLLASLPQGDALHPGTTSGTTGATRWRIDVALLRDGGANPPPRPDNAASSPWLPASIAIAASTGSGRTLRLETVGLVRLAAPR